LRFNRDLASASYPLAASTVTRAPDETDGQFFAKLLTARAPFVAPTNGNGQFQSLYGKQATRSRSGRHRRPEST
jgi:hypothetical protein